jgi:hypothetical protein
LQGDVARLTETDKTTQKEISLEGIQRKTANYGCVRSNKPETIQVEVGYSLRE